MAYEGYGARYTLTFSDVYQNTTGQYVATIYKKGYTGVITEINGTANPLTIETQRDGETSYNPIISTKATLNLLLENVGEDVGTDRWNPNTNIWENYNETFAGNPFNLIEFITADTDTFLLEVVKDGDIIWQGYYVFSSDITINEIYPISVNLVFTDSLQLKLTPIYYRWEEYPANYTGILPFNISSKQSLLDLFCRCCINTFSATNIRINFPYEFTNSYTNPDGTEDILLDMSNMYLQSLALIDKDTLTPINSFDVLKGICSQFGLVAFFKNNILYISTYDDLVNNTTRTYKSYEPSLEEDAFTNLTGNVVPNYIEDVVETDTVIALNSEDFVNIDRSQLVRFTIPYKQLSINSKALDLSNTVNYNYNGISEMYATDGSSRGVVSNWYSRDSSLESELIVNYTSPSDQMVYPFYPYATSTTPPYNWKYASRFTAGLSFSATKYIQSKPLRVSPKDFVGVGFSANRDARPKIAETSIRIALILSAKGEDGNNLDYYYNDVTELFTITPTYLSTQIVGFNISYDLRGYLNIPGDGDLSLRMYYPTNSSGSPFSTLYSLYVDYFNLQLFKGVQSDLIPKSESKIIYYEGVKNVDTSLDLDSNLFMLDGTRYTEAPSPSAGNPVKNSALAYTSGISNNIVDLYNNPVAGLTFDYTTPLENFDFSNLVDLFKDIGNSINKNTNVVNIVIEGNYKSEMYNIGQKFSYTIIGGQEVNYCLLDFNNDYKFGSQNSILYSSEFTDVTGKTTIYKTVTS